jgi:hypothetical protein
VSRKRERESESTQKGRAREKKEESLLEAGSESQHKKVILEVVGKNLACAKISIVYVAHCFRLVIIIPILPEYDDGF